MTTEEIIRSLSRNEVRVLYGRCKGKQNKEIGLLYDKTEKWAEGLMTSVFTKLGVDKKATKFERQDYLNNEVCGLLDRLLQGKEENIEKWPLYGVGVSKQSGGTVIYIEKEQEDPPIPDDPRMLALVLVDQEQIGEKNEESKHSFDTNEGKSSPPPKRRVNSPTAQARINIRRWIGILVFVGIIACAFAANNWVRGILFSPEPTATRATATLFTPTLPPTGTPTGSPTFTPTLGTPPTPVPLPISEDFSKPYSDLWTVIGNPVITEGGTYRAFSGILSSENTAIIWIGNRAWTNYIVSFRSYPGMNRSELRVGVRVKDLNNMILIDCDIRGCRWGIMVDGNVEQQGNNDDLTRYELVTITVEGDQITAIGQGLTSSTRDTQMSLVIPPKYAGQFTGGGVLFQTTLKEEIDFIEIDPLP